MKLKISLYPHADKKHGCDAHITKLTKTLRRYTISHTRSLGYLWGNAIFKLNFSTQLNVDFDNEAQHVTNCKLMHIDHVTLDIYNI